MIAAFFRKNPLLSWLLVALIAAGVAESGYLVYQNREDANEPKKMAALPETQDAAEANGDGAQQAETAGEEAPVTEVGALVPPRFDVLRVEPDGSAVIAGAAPGAQGVTLIANGAVVARTDAAPNGDFVFALDDPFEPGVYELSLQSESADGNVVMSKETGILNVPENGGELIAMVDREGGASRIMQRPEPRQTGATAAEEATAKPADERDEPQVAGADEPEPTDEQQTQAEVADEVQTAVGEEPAAAQDGDASQTVQSDADDAETTADPMAKPVMVEAVDVEGDKLFIAGSGEPGRIVNLYIDDEFLGTTVIGGQASFLLETQKILNDGQYQIRADMLAEDGETVERRAAVRLVHESPQIAQDDGQIVPESTGAGNEPDADAAIAEAPVANESGEMAVAESEGTTVVAQDDALAAADNDEDDTAAVEQMAASETERSTGAQDSGSEVAADSESMQAREIEEAAVPPQDRESQMAGNAAGSEEDAAKVTEAAPAAEVESENAVMPIVRTGDTVIIRRGDNLWRISRRMLGRGGHYTVIFDANQDQIRNPHLIYPGQIFDVPSAPPATDSG